MHHNLFRNSRSKLGSPSAGLCIPISCASRIAALKACHDSTMEASDFHHAASKKSCCTCKMPPWPRGIDELSFWATEWNRSVMDCAFSPSSSSKRWRSESSRYCTDTAHTRMIKQVSSGLSLCPEARASHHLALWPRSCSGKIG